ncbi:plastid transcriptionally active protein [Perilla frutescens var. frutescens]|nr:plastid transcriptionally active protein [Perilla frutescens var. frutescens]
MFTGGASQALRVVATVAATLVGGSFAVGFLSSSISERVTSFKKKKYGQPCRSCKAIGYYTCRLCKGNGTISWSPLYDPVFINPCVCPTCDGFKVQRCLNCLGYGCA